MSSVFRVGGISYLRIPAEDPRRSAAFYEAVFGWRVHADRDDASFEDGTGHVIGHFGSGQQAAGEAGKPPHGFGESVDERPADRGGHSGGVLTPPHPRGDPAGAP